MPRDQGFTNAACDIVISEISAPGTLWGKFSISRTAALMSNLVKNIFETDKTAKKIPINEVDKDTLFWIVSYLKHHNGRVPAEIKKPIQSKKMEKIVEHPVDAKCIDGAKKKTVFNIILAANYMDIKSVLHLGCAKIATLIKGKSPEEIKKILGDDEEGDKIVRLVNDVTSRRLLEAIAHSEL